jgi:paraquat-inducible protein B
VVKNIQLRDDGTGVNVDIFIQLRYAALARTTSLFWIVSGLDFKGGILTGVQMKIDSLRAILSGGIAFATPNKAVGEPAAENEEFPLYETPKPEWENWAPSIAIPPDDPSTDGKDDHIKNAPESVPSLMKKAH